MVNKQRIKERLAEIEGQLSLGDLNVCLAEIRDLVKAIETLEPDPLMLGHARYLEFKVLHQLERYEEGYQLMVAGPKPFPYTVSGPTAAWMLSVAAEMAAHTGRPEEVVRFARSCYDLRLKMGATDDIAVTLITACELLGMIQRPDLNFEFSLQLLKRGSDHKNHDLIVQALRFFIVNFSKTHRADVKACIAEAVSQLTSGESKVDTKTGVAKDALGWARTILDGSPDPAAE